MINKFKFNKGDLLSNTEFISAKIKGLIIYGYTPFGINALIFDFIQGSMYFLGRKIAEKETVNNRFDFQLLFLMVSVISFRSAYAIFSVLVINEIFISDTAIE